MKHIGAVELAHIMRMNEPEPLRSLRLQKEQIEDAKRREIEAAWQASEADRLRRAIRELGAEPCA